MCLGWAGRARHAIRAIAEHDAGIRFGRHADHAGVADRGVGDNCPKHRVPAVDAVAAVHAEVEPELDGVTCRGEVAQAKKTRKRSKPAIDASGLPKAKPEKLPKSAALELTASYVVADRRYEDVAHHEILMGPRYEPLLGDIFDRKVLADDFSLYLHRPTATDPSRLTLTAAGSRQRASVSVSMRNETVSPLSVAVSSSTPRDGPRMDPPPCTGIIRSSV